MRNAKCVAEINQWLQDTEQGITLPAKPTREDIYQIYKTQAKFLTHMPVEAGDLDKKVYESLEYLEHQLN